MPGPRSAALAEPNRVPIRAGFPDRAEPRYGAPRARRPGRAVMDRRGRRPSPQAGAGLPRRAVPRGPHRR